MRRRLYRSPSTTSFARSPTCTSATSSRIGGFGKFNHRREPAAIEDQTVIRLNRDTLYSAAVFDLDAGPGDDRPARRRQALHVDAGHQRGPLRPDRLLRRRLVHARQEHGRHPLCRRRNPHVGRSGGSEGRQKVHALQDAIAVSQKAWAVRGAELGPASQKKVRDALLVLAATLPDFKKAFGTKERGRPGSRTCWAPRPAWGGNPDADATYLNVTPSQERRQNRLSLTVNDVPVDGFWSVSVYNAAGYYEKNTGRRVSINNLTASEGRRRFDRDPVRRLRRHVANCLPIVAGWNYTVRLYRPRAEIVNGNVEIPRSPARAVRRLLLSRSGPKSMSAFLPLLVQ